MSTKKVIAPIIVLVLFGLVSYGILTATNIMDELQTHKVKLQDTEKELNEKNQKLEGAEKDNKGKQEKIQELEQENKKLEEELQAKVEEKQRLASAYKLASISVPTAMQSMPQASYGSITTTYTGNGMWCTDYVHSKRPDVPIYGNAGYNWIAAAQAEGRATGTAPQPGAIAVTAGHVAYVESVNGDGTYVVSEMGWNFTAGAYNMRTVGPGAFGGFIY